MRWVFMRTLATVVVLCLAGPFVRNALADKIVVYGASGSVGRVIVEEALSRGHEVIGVSRNPESLKFDNARFTAAPGDVTDPDSVAATVRGADVVVISVRGVGPGNTPQEAVTLRAATAYIEAASRLGDATPYVIQIGGGVTLYRDGVRIMDAFQPGTERYALAQGHWLAMEAYQHSTGFDWTVMSANTGSIQERGEYTGDFGSGTRTRSSIETARRTSLDKTSRSR